MIPYFVIAAAAFIGLIVWGLKGLVLGALAGYVLNLLFGSVFILLSGGLLPRKVRRATAINFIEMHPELINAAYPKLDSAKHFWVTEQAIESIFRNAKVDDQSMNLETAFTREAIRTSTSSLVEQEASLEKKRFLLALEQQIEEDMYP
jgi:signal transduction histidine kinase